jgi:DNA (cytosine-5)-methyltransferase 1
VALRNTTGFSDTTAALAGVNVIYCAEEAQARRLLGEMLDAGLVAIDIETAPYKTEVDRLARLLQARAETAGALKALRKLKAPGTEIATLAAASRRLAVEIRYAQTAGLDPHRARIRLLQVYDGGDRVLVIDLDYTGAGVLDLLDGVSVIAHNVAFELVFLETAGVALGELHCTLQATRLMLGEKATSLAAAGAAYLNLDLDKSQQTSDWNAPRLSRRQIDYAAIDAVVAWRIAKKLLPRFDVQRSAYEIQLGAVPAAMRMEQRGFKLDVEAHARLIADLEKERLSAEQEYREACLASGHTALADKAPSTPAQKEALLAALLTSDELAHWRRTEKSGALSTKRSELLRAGHYPPILALVNLSRIDKMLSSFGQTLAALVSPTTGRIHAHYRIASTASGRASCSGPNLQQIPRDPRFRALFVPEPGHVFVVADYGSMELRAAASISGDRAMTAVFEQELDLHKITASRMTGKNLAAVTDEERKGAKAVNFGGVYGQGAAGLVQAAWVQWGLVLDPVEAKAWLQAFEYSYLGFARWRRDHYQRCEARHYIVIGKDADRGIGRIFPKSRVPEGASFYTRCCNLPVQGACADASMLALAYVDDRLFDAGVDGGPVAWLHDEIVLEVREDQAERAASILKQAMIDGFTETFPGAPLAGLVEPHIGTNWGEAKGVGIRGATAETDLAGVEPHRGSARDLRGAASRQENVDHLQTRPHDPTPFYDFFCGGGMARLGLGRGWTCAFVNDIDAKKAETYAANFGRDSLVIGDVASLKPSDLPDVADLAWASPPCQDLSVAGDRAGLAGTRSGSFWPFMQLMRGLRAEGRAPRLVVIENVCGLITSHGGKDFDSICAALVDAGYRFGAVVIDAAHFVPQSRERVFIIAIDATAPIPAELLAERPKAPFQPPALVAACQRQRDPIWWRLPIPLARNSILADVIEDEPRVIPWQTQAETERLIGMMSPTNLAKVEAAKRSGKRMVGCLYKRFRPDAAGAKVQRAEVRFDDIAGCLRVPTGGSSHQRVVIVDGPSVRSRLLSPREAARLMGLPDEYKLPGNYREAYGLIADGIVVPVVRHLAEHILEPLLQRPPAAARRAVA